MKRRAYIGAGVMLVLAMGYVRNASCLARPEVGRPTLLAHRGVHQTFECPRLHNDTCTAACIVPPTTDLLENTIASMRAAFELGADVVELDIHPTTDGQVVVFHDWRLECRTNGTGETRMHSMRELR